MSTAPWWIVLISTAIGAASGIGGSVWASTVQRRSANRAEWFRRLQWAWELTQSADTHSVTAGMTMMDYLINSTDRKDGAVITGLAPIAREVGLLASRFPNYSVPDLVVTVSRSDTEREGSGGDGGEQDG